jgi:HlyD family secretion protein
MNKKPCWPKAPLFVGLFAGLLAALLGLAGCDEAPAPEAQPKLEASFSASAKGRIDIEGGLVRLAAQREGVIERVVVEEGERVKAGQLLATLSEEQPRRAMRQTQAETAQARAALAPIQLRLQAAEREAKRLQGLAADDTVARQELDTARDQVAQQRAELQLAQAAVAVAQSREQVADYEIEQRRVRAPAAGQIVRRTARAGDGVSIATVTPLFLFAPDAPLIVRAELEERWLANVRVGQKAEVVLEADETQRLPATVLRVAPVVGLRTPGDDPAERQDARVAEVVLALQGEGQPRIGQRVIVRFAKQGG